MKKRLREYFSYSTLIIRLCQSLLVIGIIIQTIKLITSLDAIVGLFIYTSLLVISYLGEKKVEKFISLEVQNRVKELTMTKNSMFYKSNIPVIVISEIGNIKWCNEAFSAVCKDKKLIGLNINTVFPEAKIGEWIWEANTTKLNKLQIGEHHYEVYIECFLVDDESKNYVIYFMDCTERDALKIKIDEEKSIIGYLCIDNIDEITHSIEEVRRPMLLAIVDRKINLWFKEKDVVVARIERDKYILVLNRKELRKMEEAKFDILDEMRSIQVGNELPVTISMGIGNNVNTLLNSKEDARIAFDLAQGRGGDQAIIKHYDKYTFYGGKTKEVEKTARVKVRIKAYAFKELLHEADKVYIMGHKNIDMDCLGAAMGVYRGAHLVGKKAQIILERPTFAIDALYSRIQESKEYEDLFITPEVARKEITKDTLLVIVDTHRRSYVENPDLLELSEKVVIFDHHRKSPDYIEESVLTYLEPFVSSTCEMISEILLYISDKIKLNPIEADALLAGITIDTKNFVFKAGVRTFEAAAFLRRSGADSTRVRMLFQNDMATYRARATAIQMTEIWFDSMGISEVTGTIEHATIVAAQVADELLNIKSIKASFVFTEVEGCIYISARALGGVNVQRIMELLGGGGHLGIAGTQLKGISIEEAKDKLKEAINSYFQEGEA